MPTLLHIDSSPLDNNASISRHLTAEFVQHWRKVHPNGKVITRDLTLSQLPSITAEWIGAAHTPPTGLSPRQREVLALSDRLIGELQAADEYVTGVAMHNFSIPAVVKLWIDQIVRAGKTFSYEGGAPAGLLLHKKATVLIASGSIYDEGTPAAAMNFIEPYLRAIFAFVGVTETRFIKAGGTAQLRYGADRQTLLEPAVASIHAHVFSNAASATALS